MRQPGNCLSFGTRRYGEIISPCQGYRVTGASSPIFWCCASLSPRTPGTASRVFSNYRMLTGRPWQRLGVADGWVAIDTPQGRASRGSAMQDCRGSAHKRARGSTAKDTGTLDQSAKRKLAITVLPLRSILIDRWRRTDEDARQARTGSPQRTQVRKLIVAPRREHSRKPEDVRERIGRLVPGPYLELFARETNPGWDCWGDQTGLFDRGAVSTRRQASRLADAVARVL
jgi:MT-A70